MEIACKINCLNKNKFCYICGNFVASKNKRNISKNVKDAYNLYFKREIESNDFLWSPEVCCTSCYTNLLDWKKGGRRYLHFKEPAKWTFFIHSQNSCYFCINQSYGYSSKTKKYIEYTETPTAKRPTKLTVYDDIPMTPLIEQPVTRDESTEISAVSLRPTLSLETTHPTVCPPSMYEPSYFVDDSPQLVNQEFLNDLIRDLKLDVRRAELLGSRLKERNLCTDDVRITAQRKRSTDLHKWFSKKKDLTFCENINAVLEYLDYPTDHEEWRLFIDSSKRSLKGVLLHNGNLYSAVPIAYSTQTAETYDSLKHMLDCIKYSTYQWNIIGDLKVVAIICGLQSGYTKYMCFLCIWDTRKRASHYIQKSWPLRCQHVVGKFNVKSPALVPSHKIILPPLHVKLGIFKNFVKALDKESFAFAHLIEAFPKLSNAKIKEGTYLILFTLDTYNYIETYNL